MAHPPTKIAGAVMTLFRRQTFKRIGRVKRQSELIANPTEACSGRTFKSAAFKHATRDIVGSQDIKISRHAQEVVSRPPD